eukprot:TRINITY_DN19076_c0_g1_i1.p2 TRINITY_DN19076_c0_g1~~TRINITY_DN19076_c0_g1_i1.p2  ORF type:complete len:194 (+),score=51.47 TRINITY_DN19076_c0_g1_i1:124-705(+)
MPTWAEVRHMASYSPLLHKMSALLQAVAQDGDQTRTAVRSPFCSRQVPQVPLDTYLCRLCKYGDGCEQVYVIMFVLLDTLLKLVPWQLSSSNVHRLIAATFVVACKSYSDHYYSIPYYSTITGIPVPELLKLEIVVLQLLEWRVMVDSEVYDSTAEGLRGYKGPGPAASPAAAVSDTPSPAASPPVAACGAAA